jgi:hypothetical protein
MKRYVSQMAEFSADGTKLTISDVRSPVRYRAISGRQMRKVSFSAFDLSKTSRQNWELPKLKWVPYEDNKICFRPSI